MPLITFVVSMIVVLGIAAFFVWSDAAHSKQEALHTDQVYSARIESLLDTLFHKTDVMESMIIAEHGELAQQTFEDLAKSLNDRVGIRAIQYLPNGVVQYVYPFEGNEAAIGGNILEKPDRREDALRAVETKQITLSGPYELTQGGLGLVARNPIFITDDTGTESFWGFSVIVLDMPKALEPIMFDQIGKAGFNYELFTSSVAGDHVVIAASEELPASDAVEYTVDVPNNDWTLRLMPTKGWVNWGMAGLIVLTGLVISSLLTIVVYQAQNKRRFLQQLATTDELTSLRNRRWFDDVMEQWCADESERFSLFYLDLNDFKTVNDTLGHKQGDELLIWVSSRIRAACDGETVLARLGGDEFIVARRCQNEEETEAFAEKLRRCLDESFDLGGRGQHVSVSVGAAAFPGDGSDYDTLMRIADANMYREKRSTAPGSCRVNI